MHGKLLLVSAVGGLILAGCMGVGAARAQETLTNADVVKMAQAHLSADVIVQQIQNNPGKYVLTAASLIRLKQAGVPDKVIAAMQAKGGARNEEKGSEEKRAVKQAVAKEATKATKGSRDPFAWEVKDAVDRMTGKHQVEGYLFEKPEDASDGEELQGKATCDELGMKLLVIYISGTTPQTGYKENPPSAPMGGLVGLFVNAVSHQRPWVLMQMKIDEGAPVAVSSESEYINYASVNFARQTLQDAMNQVDRSQPRGEAGMVNTLGMLASARGPATMQQIAGAQKVLLELPRENESKMYFEIRPQEPTFQKLMAKCGVEPGEAAASSPAMAATPEARVASAEPPAAPAFGPPPRVAKDGFNFFGTAPLAMRALNGNPDSVSASLPGALGPRLRAAGLNPDEYQKEIAYIAKVIATCGHLTEAMIDKAPPGPGNPASRLGGDYAPCGETMIDVSKQVGTDADKEQRKMILVIGQEYRRKWWDGKPLHYEVRMGWERYDEADPNAFMSRPLTEYVAEYGDMTLSAGGPAGSPGMVAPANAATLMLARGGQMVQLTPRSPVSVVMRQTAATPAPNMHYYRPLTIDTRDFPQGGVLIVDVQVPANGMAGGNFDLFPADVPIPRQGSAQGILASADNVAPGTSGQLVYRFATGRLFTLGIEGARQGRPGLSSFVQFQVSVRPQ